MGDERAETYLRVLAEARLLGVLRPARRWPAPPGAGAAGGPPGTGAAGGPPGTGGPRVPIPAYRDFRSEALAPVTLAGCTLAAAGLLDDSFAERMRADVQAALIVRSAAYAERSGGLARLSELLSGPAPPTPAAGPAPTGPTGPTPGSAVPLRLTRLGQVLRVASDRAPFDLHLMTLVRGPAEAVIITVIVMHWPDDGSSADLEMTGAGIQHLPYDQPWMTDDRGARYSAQFDGDGGTVSWQGVVRLFPPPPPGIRWLDLIADGGTHLLRLDLPDQEDQAAEVTTEDIPGLTGAERLLATEAEGILAGSWDPRGPSVAPDLGQIVAVLTDAGALAPDGPALGQLTALCRQLGVTGHGLTAPPAADLPGPWASVPARLRATVPVRSGADPQEPPHPDDPDAVHPPGKIDGRGHA